MSDYIHHLTLDTNHLRRSARREVDDGVLAIVGQALDTALGASDITALPGPTPLGLSASATGRALLATLWSPMTPREAAIADVAAKPWSPLVTLAVAPRATVGARLWPQILVMVDDPPPSIRRPPAPWVAVALHAALARHASLSWIADAERVIAWAWMEARNDAR